MSVIRILVVEDNPKNLKFILLDFAAQSRSLPDLDAAVGYTYFYQAAKVPASAGAGVVDDDLGLTRLVERALKHLARRRTWRPTAAH